MSVYYMHDHFLYRTVYYTLQGTSEYSTFPSEHYINAMPFSATMVLMNMAPPNSVGPSATDNSKTSRQMLHKHPQPNRRRTRSKGTIAGFKSPDGTPDAQTLNAENASNALDASNHPQHLQGETPMPVKPCHSAKLALLCVQNAQYMGARTQVSLCPPGKARDDMTKALLERRRRKKKLPAPPTIRRNLSFSRAPSLSSVGSRIEETSAFERLMGESGVADYEKAEWDYLTNPGLHSRDLNSDGYEIQEDPSSGDEDSLDFVFDDDDKFGESTDEQPVREPLYTLGLEGTASNNQGQGSTSSSKMAFNFRKLKWFDAITASDRAEARSYLRKEMSSLKKRDAMILTKHLRKLQRREKRRLEIERGQRNGNHNHSLSDHLLSDTEEEGEEFIGGVSKFPSKMTASLSAALVLESLAFNPLESLEGMSKCYEGIVAAGTALLDFEDQNSGSKLTKKDVINALTPLLITTLEQPSGETVLALANLRKMCGTRRYQRRFIQRIAPFLVRPPNAAVWCLRHQNDMKAIFAATELILDSATDIFSADWFEHGRTLLADSKRAESLELAAMQLKRLSTPDPHESLITTFSSSHHRRGNSFSISTPSKDAFTPGSNVNTELLAEWEILAVDREIRDSIKNLFNRDWSRINIRFAPPREGESPHPNKKLRGISAGKTKATPPPPHESESNAESRSPSLTYHNKHLLPNSVGSGYSVPATTAEPLPQPNKNGDLSLSDSVRTDPQPSPPQTPKRTTAPTDSPIRASPPALESTSFDPKIIISPRVGAPSAPTIDKAPLSPQKQMSRRNDSNRVATNSPGSTSSAQRIYLRTLTSTAAERKRTVAACRALRAQITRFETAFAKVNGRPPKGAQERAPLATTYAQYREWKRAIRSDAASRIQAMYRGARLRSMLIQDVKWKRVIEKRAGRPIISKPPPPPMPTDIGSHSQRETQQSVAPMPLQRRDDPSTTVYDGVEVLLSENQNLQSSGGSSRRSVDELSLNYSTTGSTAGSISSMPYSPRADNSVSSERFGDLIHLTLSELQTQKRELKQLLKGYDMDFHRKHGRMPVKAEKEPIRNLYERYNALKNRISVVEKNPSLISPRSQWQGQSPSSISQGSIQTFPDYNSNNSVSDNTNQSSGQQPLNAPRVPGGRSTRRHSEPPISVPPPKGQDLQALKTEKQHLHAMLRAYERDFFRINNRQVSCYNDIRPVAPQYKRYKEIKRSILALQQSQI